MYSEPPITRITTSLPNANCQKNELASHTAHCSYGLPTRRNVEASALQRLIFFTKCILSVADLLIIQLA